MEFGRNTQNLAELGGIWRNSAELGRIFAEIAESAELSVAPRLYQLGICNNGDRMHRYVRVHVPVFYFLLDCLVHT